MKELSIEEKAKRYDEAIKLAKNSFNYPDYTGFIRADVIFPELKEDEDERIRQFLIHEVTETSDKVMSYRNMNKKDVLIWLEKQSKQKSVDKVEPKFRIGDVIEVKPMKCHGKIFIGKPNKIVDITEKSYIFDDGKAYSIELQDGWKLSEHSPTLGEEDENMIADLTIIIDTYFSEISGLHFKHDLTKDKISSWFKSLKIRYTWKPSNDQMDMLAKVCSTLHLTSGENEIMESLYDDLKKLKG